MDNKSEHSKLGPLADTEENVYCFGVLLLEIISGKFPYSEEHGPLVDWVIFKLHFNLLEKPNIHT